MDDTLSFEFKNEFEIAKRPTGCVKDNWK
jgi:hypothetical protein